MMPHRRCCTLFALFAPAALLTACGTIITPPQAPRGVSVPEGNMVANILKGEGVLRYECRAGASGMFAWTVPMPEAVLKDQSGAIVGRYRFSANAAPSWEHLDGSKVSGMVLSSASVPGNLDLQRVKAAPASAARRGTMAGVTFIQQLNTAGGAVSGECTAAKAGAIQTVRYSADYYFYKPDFSDRVEPM